MHACNGNPVDLPALEADPDAIDQLIKEVAGDDSDSEGFVREDVAFLGESLDQLDELAERLEQGPLEHKDFDDLSSDDGGAVSDDEDFIEPIVQDNGVRPAGRPRFPFVRDRVYPWMPIYERYHDGNSQGICGTFFCFVKIQSGSFLRPRSLGSLPATIICTRL